MPKIGPPTSIRLRGVRHNNLKNFNLNLPLGQLIVITGLSGSGKSSLAFDTLFAEGQRRYIETFSPYARQFLDRMDKPQVDSIEGIPPAIAIEQRNTVKTTRSTVGTMTEICDYAKLLWSHLAKLSCRKCGRLVVKDSPQKIFAEVSRDVEWLITFDLPISDKLPLSESLGLIARQGYQRILHQDQPVRIDEFNPPQTASTITVIQDRLRISDDQRARFVEACEQAYHFGKGKLSLRRLLPAGSEIWKSFSNRFHCANCDIDYRPPVAPLFSFNHPLGACPACRGFGRIIEINYRLAIPDRSKSLADGAVKPWQSGHGLESQADLLKFCAKRRIPTGVPFAKLPPEVQHWVIEGDPDYGKDSAHEWPRAWYGVKGYFRWLESKAYKMHVRVLLARYRSYILCPDCRGQRFQPESLLYRLGSAPPLELPGTDRLLLRDKIFISPCISAPQPGLTIAEFYQLPVHRALEFVRQLQAQHPAPSKTDPLALALQEVSSRLSYLQEVGLGYLTLDRPTRSLSGGETERVNLTTCLGSRLVNTLFVLDEPSVGLHPRDTNRLIQILKRLRDADNTVVVVEHEANVMRSADQIVDLGPGHGESGGQIVFQGSFEEILSSNVSLTGQYLSGRRTVPIPKRRAVNKKTSWLTIANASAHNLRNIRVAIPLGRLVCVTGVSGSGKSTLLRDVLMPALESRLAATSEADPDPAEAGADNEPDSSESPASAEITGVESIGQAILVDQSPLGRTPRSNPAVYIGAFEYIRELFAQTDLAKQRGLNASAFSFNSPQGQCERCRGAGFEKIEMQFLSDVFVRCPDCNGRRYRPHILEVFLTAPSLAEPCPSPSHPLRERKRALRMDRNIAQLLEMTVDEALLFLCRIPGKAGRGAVSSLKLLQDVGLGYLRLGQPINTLSGGESQRLKLVKYLAEFESAPLGEKPALFLFDEPTTGLHFEDVRVLLEVFQRLVERGHSAIIIEHNLDVIKTADWVIDLGPEAGDKGGQVVATGTPETIAAVDASLTGQALREFVFPRFARPSREAITK